jgi:hypothetical protein
MFTAVSEFTKSSQRLSETAAGNTKRRKRFQQPAGRLFPIFHREICDFSIFYFFSAIDSHSLVGLENESMMLLGGQDASNEYQTGIWNLKNGRWRQIGDLVKV